MRNDRKDERELRRQIRLMLYQNPLSDYVSEEKLRVLIYGEEESALAAWKEVFALGQIAYLKKTEKDLSYVSLQITIVTDIGKMLEERLLTQCSALSELIAYAETVFSDRMPEDIFDLKIKAGIDGYELIGKGQTICSIDKEIIDEFELLNLNQKYDNFLGKKETNYYSFKKTRQEREKQISEDPYMSDSSEASTAHIPVRLSLFGETRDEAEKELSRLLVLPAEKREADARYRALVSLEHRRWCAYMVAEGFKAPSKEEFEEYAYRNGKKHRTGKLHPCLCDGGTDPFFLKNHPEAFSWDDYETRAELSELDRFSIRAHRLCEERAKEKTEETLAAIRSLEVTDAALSEYCQISRRFVRDEGCDDTSLYQSVIRDAKTIKDGRFRERIDQIHGLLDIFFVRNARRDYALLDTKIIDAMAFDLWHGRKYQTVICYCGDSALESLKVPFLLSAMKVIYLYDPENDNSKKTAEKIREFADRRSFEGCLFEKADFSYIDSIKKKTEELIKIYGPSHKKDQVVLTCPNDAEQAVLLAMGDIASTYTETALLEARGVQIFDLRTGEEVPLGVLRQLKAEEYLRLRASQYENVLEYHPSFEEMKGLTDVFRKYAPIKTLDGRPASVWSSMQEYFNHISSGNDYTAYFEKSIIEAASSRDQKEKSPQTGKIEKLHFCPAVFEKLHLADLLSQLADNRIIGSVRGSLQDGFSILSPDYSVRIILRCLGAVGEDWLHIPREVSFSRSIEKKDPIQIIDTRGKTSVLFAKEEKKEIREGKKSLLMDMVSESIIENVNPPELLSLPVESISLCSNDFCSLELKKLFQSPGKIFELILFRKIQAMDLFADVQNGVKIAWSDENFITDEVKFINYLQTHQGYGKTFFTQAVEEVKKVRTRSVENEIDVVLMNDLKPVFISCKTGKKLELEWIYEIGSVAEHFGAVPALAVSFDLKQKAEGILNLAKRAYGMGISLFGYETIFDEDSLKKCMKTIAEGKVFRVVG